jgi:hypothetical protein
MTMNCTLRRTLQAASILGVFLSLAGCSSGPDATETIDSLGRFGQETARISDSVDSALKALEALVGTPGEDLKTPFQAYAKNVDALDAQSKVVKAHAADLKAKGDGFFKEWEADTAETVTPERRKALADAYGKIKSESIKARDGFEPFLASLKDIKGYLALDLTRKGVESMKELTGKARTAGTGVRDSIFAVVQQTNLVRGMLPAKPK